MYIHAFIIICFIYMCIVNMIVSIIISIMFVIRSSMFMFMCIAMIRSSPPDRTQYLASSLVVCFIWPSSPEVCSGCLQAPLSLQLVAYEMTALLSCEPLQENTTITQETHKQQTAQRSTAQHSTAQHSTAQHSTARHGTARHGTARHGTARHGTAQRSTAQHSTAQHSTAQRRAITVPLPSQPVLLIIIIIVI